MTKAIAQRATLSHCNPAKRLSSRAEMAKFLFDPVKLPLAALLVINAVFIVRFMSSREREPLYTQTFVDCSIGQSGLKQEASPFWTESQKFMNVSHRAKRAVEIFLLHKRPRGIIVDIGSGFQALRREVPKSMSYRPVDLFQRVEGSPTSICNLNRLQFPFFVREEVAAYFFLGSFEYILDKVSVLRLCRKREAPVIMQYQIGMIGKGNRHEWVAPLSTDALQETADIVGYKLVMYDDLLQSDGSKGGTFLYFEPV